MSSMFRWVPRKGWGWWLRRLGVAIVCAAMFLLGPISLRGQEAATEERLQLLEGEWTCQDCVRANPVLTLGDTAASALGPATLESVHSLALDGSGLYWVAQISSFKVFDAAGDLVAVVGREGQGPAEFGRRPGPAFSDYAGNVHIIDNMNARESVYSPVRELMEDHRLVAWTRAGAAMPDSVGAVRRVVNADAHTDELVGIPLHLMRGDSVVVSFGEPTEGRVVRPMDLRRRVGTSGDGRILSADVYEYIIRWWDSRGRLLKTLEGRSINDGPVPSTWTMDFGPPGKMIDLQVDADGHLWTMRTEAFPSWRSEIEEEVPLPSGVVAMRLRNGDPNTVLETHLDVVDTSTGRVLATGTAPGAWAGFLAPGLAWQPRITDAGVPYITVWRFEE